MKILQTSSIKGKLVLMSMLICGVVLLLVMIAAATYEALALRRGTVHELSALAEVIAANSRASLAFHDADAAHDTLAGLAVRQAIIEARIFDREDRLFAEYVRDVSSPRSLRPVMLDGYRFEGDHLWVTAPVVLDAERLGTVLLRSDLREHRARLKAGAAIVGTVLLLAVLIAWLLATRWQRVISQPILNLARVADAVTEQKDYSLRAVRESNDETGKLVDAFNHMLDQIAADITERKALERRILEISDQEKQRIGQDLHDGLCQHLTATKFVSKVLEDKLTERSLVEAADAGHLGELINQAIAQARDVARGLSPVTLEAEGLSNAIEYLANSVERIFKIPCLFDTDGPVAPPTLEVATHLYRIAQEATHNALRHAHASQIAIMLNGRAGQIVLTVRDDGRGIPEPPPTGMGLQTMRYRAGLIGATLDIQTRHDAGTTITCTWRKS